MTTKMCLGLGTAVVLVTLLAVKIAQAGPYVAPGGAPPVAAPAPDCPPPPGDATVSPFPGFQCPQVGQPFPPPDVLANSVATPVSTLWEIDICRFGQGQWSVNDPAVIQDSIGPDLIHFRLCLNFVPQVGVSAPFPWRVWVVFGANPWNFPSPTGPAAIPLSNTSVFYTTIAIPEPESPIGTFGYLIVLTDSSGTVIDFIDPVLVTGSALLSTALQVNDVKDLVTFEPIESTFMTIPCTTDCPDGFVATFSFDARLTNISTSPDNLVNLRVLVEELTNGNLLQNADGAPGGEEAMMTIPETDAFSDGVLGAGEAVDVHFDILLTNTNPFVFRAEVLAAEKTVRCTGINTQPIPCTSKPAIGDLIDAKIVKPGVFGDTDCAFSGKATQVTDTTIIIDKVNATPAPKGDACKPLGITAGGEFGFTFISP